ncbi:MAG: glycosyltransferase family 2 protein [Chitinophagaceae bacterium]
MDIDIFVFLFIGIATYQILYFLVFFTKPLLFSCPINYIKSAHTSCSIIIVCQNEEDFIEKKLPYFLNQKTTIPFEIMVVDLNSSDNTLFLLNAYQEQYSFLKKVRIEQDPKSIPIRNYAFSVGVIEASYDKIIYIDNLNFSYCSPHWLEEMLLPFNNQSKNAVLGYTTYKTDNTLINKWRRYINIHHNLISWGFVSYKSPIFTKLSNVIFDKKLFLEDKKFVHTNHLRESYKQAYGLLKNKEIFLNNSANTIIYEKIESDISFEYKKWYGSLFSYTNWGYNMINFFYFISQMFFWTLGAVSIYIFSTTEFIDISLLYTWLSVFLFREFLYLFYFIRATIYKFREKNMIIGLFLGDILYAFHVVYYFKNIFSFKKLDLK